MYSDDTPEANQRDSMLSCRQITGTATINLRHKETNWIAGNIT